MTSHPLDITDTAGYGYKTLLMERDYFIRLAAIPVLIKLACHFAVIWLGWETNFTRQALVLLPSFFADGWMLSHVVRLVFLGQRWPFQFSGNEQKDMERLQDRARGITAGALTLVLIRFLTTGLAGFLNNIMRATPAPEENPLPESTLFFGSVLILLLTVWAFRLAWLYIPAAANLSLRRYITDIGGLVTSLRMIGVWMICVMPFMALLLIFSSALGVPPSGDMALSLMAAATILQVLTDTAISLTVTAAMAHGIKELLEKSR